MELATPTSLDSEVRWAKIKVVADAVMEVRMLPPGEQTAMIDAASVRAAS
jgi:hypothetical protein